MATSTARTNDEGVVPPPAAAIVDLLNSRAYAGRPDKLDTPASAEAVLRPFGQEGAPTPQRLDLVRALRADLLAVTGSSDPADSAGNWAAFSGRASSVTFQQDFASPGQVRLRQITGDPVVGGITQHVATIIAEGNWSRLRLCANEVCRAAFYDTTRNRSRRWHSYGYCGNRTNVAAHRARSAASDDTVAAKG
ncbi:CGNR zinc finger domain-containing protein [Micromonospora foliorum]|uniref:CGNR zinc finger domain-containing protein n=1 Tax=Micromonospora foliorum TaxID=2911210 RepID=UPI001EE8538E|nr:CGNR zinc finger domain-containing protein [Micromonospora foliorum]MCG5439108.1 CGNR zinc finger domain-containing protein [Micromonospora foliorum]